MSSYKKNVVGNEEEVKLQAINATLQKIIIFRVEGKSRLSNLSFFKKYHARNMLERDGKLFVDVFPSTHANDGSMRRKFDVFWMEKLFYYLVELIAIFAGREKEMLTFIVSAVERAYIIVKS